MYKDLDLVLVNVFHRHGERAPLKMYEKPLGRITACTKVNEYSETLPVKKMSFWKSLFSFQNKQPLSFQIIYKRIPDGECAPGQLTDHGKKRLFELGRRLKKDYVETGFINGIFNSSEVHLTSTDFQRTVESLQSLLKGLFKDSHEPIPINIGKRGVNSLYSSKYCESYLKEKSFHLKSVEEKHKDKIKQIFDYVSVKFPVLKDSKSPYEIFDIINSSIGNKCDYFKGFCPKIFRMAEIYSLDKFFGLLERKKNLTIYRGEIIKDLHDRIKNAVEGQYNKTKMFILSAHDVTIYPMLMVFNLQDNKWPGFGSNLVYETFKDKNDNYFVRVKYNGNVKNIPGCTRVYKNDKSLCSVEDFLRICSETIPKNKQELCSLK